MTSSSRRKLRTTAWNAATGIEPSAPRFVDLKAVTLHIAMGLAIFAATATPGTVSPALGDDQSADAAAAESSVSMPPAGVLLEEAPDQAAGEAVADAADDAADDLEAGQAPEPDDSIVLVALADTTTAATQKTAAQKEKDAAKNPCGDQTKDCKEALKNLRDDGIASIALDIRVGGRPGSDYPCECRLEGETFQPRRFATTMMTWKAAGNCHKPLYFEDWNLERYGHSHGPLDPVFSAAHFFVTLPVLPYKMGVELPWECVYPLGYYRPGNCAPWTVPAVPISCRGFAVEAATVTGLVFLLP
jgi:hypothetical protein